MLQKNSRQPYNKNSSDGYIHIFEGGYFHSHLMWNFCSLSITKWKKGVKCTEFKLWSGLERVSFYLDPLQSVYMVLGTTEVIQPEIYCDIVTGEIFMYK